MRLPPDIVSPFDEARPAVEIPPANVEVAVEVAKMAANSGVVASPPLEVRQVPDGIWKQPTESAIPLLNVEVAPEERLIEPPVIVNPDEVAKKPGATRPVYNVEVAD